MHLPSTIDPRERFLLVLANAAKNGGHCVAGRELLPNGQDSRVGPWLRPLGTGTEGTLQRREVRLADGTQPSTLDVLAVPLQARSGDEGHAENHRIVVGKSWRRVGTFPHWCLGAVTEKPTDLWHHPDDRQDRVTPTHFRALQRPSLCLVRPENLMLRLDLSQGRPRHRARFRLGGIQHNLALTDPLATNLHALQMHSQGAPALDMRPSFGDDCLICVSLTGEFQGFHWKLAAAIIPLVLQL